jgi:hypothetical protein
VVEAEEANGDQNGKGDERHRAQIKLADYRNLLAWRHLLRHQQLENCQRKLKSGLGNLSCLKTCPTKYFFLLNRQFLILSTGPVVQGQVFLNRELKSGSKKICLDLKLRKKKPVRQPVFCRQVAVASQKGKY